MKRVSGSQLNQEDAYLPHHAVVTKQLRVVFNVSQKASNGKTLNDFLHVGAKLQVDIATLLLRWRLGRCAFTADIIKMYRQIQIDNADVSSSASCCMTRRARYGAQAVPFVIDATFFLPRIRQYVVSERRRHTVPHNHKSLPSFEPRRICSLQTIVVIAKVISRQRHLVLPAPGSRRSRGQPSVEFTIDSTQSLSGRRIRLRMPTSCEHSSQGPSCSNLSGSNVQNIRRIAAGTLVLQLKKNVDNASTLGVELGKNFGNAATASALQHTTMIDIRDLNECANKEEIAEALGTSLNAPHPNKDEVKTLRKAYVGTQVAVAALLADLATKALKLSHIRIGWMNCRIRGREDAPRCYRCWSPGHFSARCKGPDRSGNCFRCGQAGHQIKDCASSATQQEWLEPSRRSCPTLVGPEVVNESLSTYLKLCDGHAGLHPSSRGCTSTSLPARDQWATTRLLRCDVRSVPPLALLVDKRATIYQRRPKDVKKEERIETLSKWQDRPILEKQLCEALRIDAVNNCTKFQPISSGRYGALKNLRVAPQRPRILSDVMLKTAKIKPLRVADARTSSRTGPYIRRNSNLVAEANESADIFGNLSHLAYGASTYQKTFVSGGPKFYAFRYIKPSVEEGVVSWRYRLSGYVWPLSVNPNNAALARKNLENRYKLTLSCSYNGRKKLKYKIGDLVRISRAKNAFAKGYEGGWTIEIFKIKRISKARQPAVYYVEDLAEYQRSRSSQKLQATLYRSNSLKLLVTRLLDLRTQPSDLVYMATYLNSLGDSGIGSIYAGSRYQRGHGGIGCFLAGLFRRVLPVLRSGAKFLGKETTHGGSKDKENSKILAIFFGIYLTHTLTRMDSLEISRMLFRISDHTVGVFPVDQILKVWTKPTEFILNTDDHTKPGMHWARVVH
ncbi:unnamed protein product [Trichogramma brassicae]|uniref:CCHC-type domain-containing protein n=1 Tax=Trichogramma brassicae TaxID=86971 RepID=A0A6H5I3R1_9HYME|nr:unnamed protein product [Trichogramma brassicae]